MPSPRGQRIVIFGDSLSEGAASPGGSFGESLRQAGAEVLINARRGRSAWNFYKLEDAAAQFAEIRAFEPTLAVVVLGTNDIGLSLSSDLQRMLQIRDALRAAGADVWAFGPPSFPSAQRAAGADGVFSMMRAAFADRLIDLRPLTVDQTSPSSGRASDGVHFTAAGGRVAGERMAQAFSSASSDSGILMPLAILLGIYLLLR